MYRKQFLWLCAFYSSFFWFFIFTKTIFPSIFLRDGITFTQMIVGIFLGYLSPFLLVVFWRRLSSKVAWYTSISALLGYVLLVVSIHSVLQFYLASFLNGCGVYLFFVFYNSEYFEHVPRAKVGGETALMFSIPIIISIAAPLLAGYIAQISMPLLWVFACIFFLITLCFIRYQKDFILSYNLDEALEEIKETRLLIFLEGIWEAVPFAIIPVYTLYFIKTPFSYGAFFAYLSCISIIANFTLGKITDRLQKRVVFLYPLTILMSVITFTFAFVAQDIRLWIVVTSLLQFLLPLFWNISMAMVIDEHHHLRKVMPGREFVFAAGRMIGVTMVLISFLIEKTPHVIFFILGCVFLMYPLFLFWNKDITKKYKYL